MKKLLIPAIALLSLFVVLGVNQAKAYISIDQSTLTVQYRTFDFFATSTASVAPYATTTNATSTSIAPYWDSNGRLDNGAAYIPGAKKVTFYFSRAGTVTNTGSTTFNVQVSPDGTNWYAYNKLVQNIATSTPNITTTANIVVTGTSTTIASMDLVYDNFYAVRCIAVIATDGTASCKSAITY